MAPNSNPVEGLNGLTLHLAPLFAAGVVAAGVLVARDRVRRLPWHWLAALAAAPVVILIVVQGSVWTVRHYFWIDLALGPAMAMLLAAVATGRPRLLVRLLDTRPLNSLGSFSYSLYLVHLPIIMVISRRIAAPLVGRGEQAFWITLVLGVPISLVAAWVFASIFELPFQRHRSYRALTAAARARSTRLRSSLLRRPGTARPSTAQPSSGPEPEAVDLAPLGSARS
jgi:peptidoglycan/LPS O-acetylase OafA/YrhL